MKSFLAIAFTGLLLGSFGCAHKAKTTTTTTIQQQQTTEPAPAAPAQIGPPN
jgi:hypothetical protein